MRTENDLIGTMQIEDDVLFGIHSLRATVNFPDKTPFHKEWYQSIGTVKKACYITYRNYRSLAESKYGHVSVSPPWIGTDVIAAMIQAASEIELGDHFKYFIVPAVQGGAGTSIHMNINEVIANRALQFLNLKPGDYGQIDPIEQANIFQSTNDVIPTSLKLCTLKLLGELETHINTLRASIEKLEKDSQGKLRIGYTQMQEAVPSTYGRLFSTYNDGLSRDWWRVSKCAERIKVVNLGGSAIGTGITVPRYFLHEVVQTLQQLTGLPLARAENLQDATANLDPFVEVHAILKAHAVNLEKLVSDLRLLSSDLVKDKEIRIPQLQVGSSIMPGKINPVIPEFVISAVHKIYSNDQLITALSGMGCLDLNPYLPVIGHALLESIKLLTACDQTISANLIQGLIVNEKLALQNLFMSPSIATALLPFAGYHKASVLAKEMKTHQLSIIEANRKLGLMEEKKLLKILESHNLLKEGYSFNDIIDFHEERKRK